MNFKQNQTTMTKSSKNNQMNMLRKLWNLIDRRMKNLHLHAMFLLLKCQLQVESQLTEKEIILTEKYKMTRLCTCI